MQEEPDPPPRSRKRPPLGAPGPGSGGRDGAESGGTPGSHVAAQAHDDEASPRDRAQYDELDEIVTW